MSFAKCKICGEWGWESHRCAPKWSWRTASRHEDDEWQTCHARDAHEAAKKAAEEYDRDDHPLLIGRGGREVEIHVRDPHSGAVTKWICTAETEPHYYAHEAR